MIDFNAERERSRLYENIRYFFKEKNYLEVFTPSLSPTLIPEPTIYTFKTNYYNEFGLSKELYLIPSPEIYIKEMLSQGSGSLFEISRCFRNAEQSGKIHNSEFDMLEYYSVGFDEKDSIPLTIEFLLNTSIRECEWLKEENVRIYSMEELLKRYTNIDLRKVQEKEKLQEEAKRLGLSYDEEESWPDTFERIFLNFVEINIEKDKIVFITDYPKQIECLCKEYDDKPYKKRWELYIKGIEVANCYDEETDEDKIKLRLKREQEVLEKERKGTNNTISKMVENFPAPPQCSGVALGLDRLLMLEYGSSSIKDIISFPFEE